MAAIPNTNVSKMQRTACGLVRRMQLGHINSSCGKGIYIPGALSLVSTLHLEAVKYLLYSSRSAVDSIWPSIWAAVYTESEWESWEGGSC